MRVAQHGCLPIMTAGWASSPIAEESPHRIIETSPQLLAILAVRPICESLRHQTMHPDEVYHSRIVRLHIEVADHNRIPMLLPVLNLIQFGDYLTGDYRLVGVRCTTEFRGEVYACNKNLKGV